MEPLNNLIYQFEFESQPLGFYSSVAVKKETREASKAVDKSISEFNTDLWMR
jgi:hypothetical protein